MALETADDSMQSHENDQNASNGSPAGSEVDDEAGSAGSSSKRKRDERLGPIQAACMYCRKSKMKCIRPTENDVCKRCRAANIICETRPRGSTRKKEDVDSDGSKPKHSARDYITIPANILSTQNAVDLPPELMAGSHSSQLSGFDFGQLGGFGTAQGFSLGNGSDMNNNNFTQNNVLSSFSSTSVLPINFGAFNQSQPVALPPMAIPPNHISPTASDGQASSSSRLSQPLRTDRTGEDGSRRSVPRHLGEKSPHVFTSTPLEMLASLGAATQDKPTRSSGLSSMDLFKQPFASLSPAPSKGKEPLTRSTRTALNQRLTDEDFFTELPAGAAALDYDESLDPIHAGILSSEEATSLFELYWEHLHPLMQCLDRRINSCEQMRHQNTFLFTAVLATAAKFQQGSAAVAQRLDKHVKQIIGQVVVDGSNSLEVVWAFVLLGPYLDPGPHMTLDPTSTYLSIAFHKFQDLVKPTDTSTYEARLRIRAFERCHLILLSYERGASLVTGIPHHGFLIQENDVIEHIVEWAASPEAVAADKTAAALATIRKDVPEVLRLVSNYEQSLHKQKGPRPGTGPPVIKAIISGFLENWRNNWISETDRPDYIKIVGHHTALSVICTALGDHIGHPTENEILQQALVAAIQTCQAYASTSAKFRSYLGNNTSAMVCYAGCFVLKLLDRWREPGTPLETSIYKLLNQIAKEMEAAGSNPPHRFGRARIYGQRLTNLLQRQVRSRCVTRHSSPVPSGPHDGQGSSNQLQLQIPLQHSGTTPNPFQASGDGNTFLAAPAPLMQSSNVVGYPQDNQNQQQQNILDFSNPFDFNAFAIPHSELDMAALSEDKLNELLPSNCWLPVGTDDLLDIAAQFGHQYWEV